MTEELGKEFGFLERRTNAEANPAHWHVIQFTCKYTAVALVTTYFFLYRAFYLPHVHIRVEGHH